MLRLIKGVQTMVEVCTEVKPGEAILVIAENEPSAKWLGQIVASVTESMGACAVSAVMPPRTLDQPEPPAPLAAAMQKADVIFSVCRQDFMCHSTARKEATAVGARYYLLKPASISELEENTLSREAMDLIKERTESIAAKLSQAATVRITSPSGTDLTMTLAGRTALAIHPKSPVLGTLIDYAEAAIAPVEGTAEGTAAVTAILGWNYLIEQPLYYSIKGGKVVDITGRATEVDKLHKIFATDENANNVAELGIGTSHIIPGLLVGTRRDAARLGTAHIGIGRNDDIGGKTWSQIHLDSFMQEVKIELDFSPLVL